MRETGQSRERDSGPLSIPILTAYATSLSLTAKEPFMTIVNYLFELVIDFSNGAYAIFIDLIT